MKIINWFWLLLTIAALGSGMLWTTGIFAVLFLLSFDPYLPFR